MKTTFRTIPTTPAAVHDLLVEVDPAEVVIEVGAADGGGRVANTSTRYDPRKRVRVQIASTPSSPVRMRMQRSRLVTKILPSPISPLLWRAPLRIASMAR